MPAPATNYTALAAQHGGIPLLDYGALAQQFGGIALEEKPVHHTSNDIEELRASAERQSPKVGDAVARATEGVANAKVEAVRDSKDSDRIADKAERQGVQPSQVGDVLAAKVTVPDQASAEKVLANLHQEMPVETANGKVTGDPQKNAVRQTQAIISTNAPAGEPVKKAEVILQTPEMAKATDQTHDDYRKAQELRSQGKEAEAAALEKKIASIHDKAEREAQLRNQPATGEKKYKFGNTQANIHPDSEAAKALDAARARIPESDLAGDGKDIGDGGNHVTVRYGIKGEDTAGIKKFLSEQPPFTASLGKTQKFPPSAHSDGAAVIVAPIESADLHRLNDEIQKHGEFAPSSFPEYKPHATVAYVDPAKADRYVGMDATHGKTFTIDSIAISDRNGNHEIVKLQGKKPSESAPATKDQIAALAAKLNTSATPRPPDNLKNQDVEVRDAKTGEWKPGTVVADYLTGGNDGIRRLRGVYADGSKFDNVKAADVRKAQASPAVSPAPGHHADVGVDFDGTLFTQTEDGSIGKPIPARIQSVKDLLAQGKTVQIETRRVQGRPEEVKKIQDALASAGLPRLPVTDQKTAKILFDNEAHHAPTDANTPLTKSNNSRKK